MRLRSRASAPALAEGLNRFRIRVKVEIEDRLGGHRGARGARARRSRAGRRGHREPEASIASRVDWPDAHRASSCSASAGRRSTRRSPALRAAGADEIDADAYEALRIEAGVPRQGFDIDETHDPAGGVPRARRGLVHEGLLPRPGARVPHRHPRPREPAPAPAALRTRRSRAAPRWSPTARRSARSRAAVGGVALAMVRRTVEPGDRGASCAPRPAMSIAQVEAVDSLIDGHGVGRQRHDEAAAAVGRRVHCRRSRPSPSASSRTIARPRPVPTDRPGVVAHRVEPLEHVRRGRRPGCPGRRRSRRSRPARRRAACAETSIVDGRVLQRVLDEVGDDLRQPFGIELDRERRAGQRRAASRPSSRACGANASAASRTISVSVARPRVAARTRGCRGARGRAGRGRAVRAGAPRRRSRSRRACARRDRHRRACRRRALPRSRGST